MATTPTKIDEFLDAQLALKKEMTSSIVKFVDVIQSELIGSLPNGQLFVDIIESRVLK